MARAKVDRKKQLRELYGLEFPESFFAAWELARKLAPREPYSAFYDGLTISLSGAFDVLAGKFDKKPPKGKLWTHDMCYHDPPEFQTVFWGHNDGLHFGLWWDDPAGPATCMASFYNSDGLDLNHYPADVFLMLRQGLEEAIELMEEDEEDEEETVEQRKALAEIREAIRPYMPGATKRRKDTGHDYTMRYMEEDVYERNIVAESWGYECICAPAETYREPSKKNETIWREARTRKGAAKWLKEADEALRAGYPATALKLGKDVYHAGKKEDEPAACAVMEAAYVALGRGLFAEILKARTAQRAVWDAGRGG